MGAPGPTDDAVPVGEEGRQLRFEVPVPKDRAGEPTLRGAPNHAFHDHGTRQVEPHQQIRTPQQQWPRLAVLPLGHPPWLSGEGSYVSHEAVARGPAGPVVQSINL